MGHTHNKCKTALHTLATATAVALAFLAWNVSIADAYIGSPLAPIASPSCWASACAGGDGVDYINLLNGNYNWGNINAVRSRYLTTVMEDTRVIPQLQLIPALRTVTLTGAAFGVGYLIGTAINHKWLHIDGAGLGNTADAPSTTSTSACAPYSTCDYLVGAQWQWGHVCYGATCLDGSFIKASNYVRDGSNVGAQAAGFLTTARDGPLRVWLTLLHATAAVFQKEGVRCNSASDLSGTNFDVNNGPSSTCTNPTYPYYVGDNTVYWIPGKDYIGGNGLRVDQPPQTYSSQPYTISTGWPNSSTGAGITSDASTYDTGPTNPAPTVIQDGSAVTTVNTSGGALSLPDIGLDPISTGDENDLNCRIAPSDYACPTAAPDGESWSDDGGVIAPSWTMPTCAGMTVAACETAITSAAEGAHVTVPSFDELELGIGQADLTKAAGAVVTTFPDGATVINSSETPATVTINFNPDPLPIELPAPGSNMTEDEWLAELEGEGYTGTVTTIVLDPNFANPNMGPDAPAKITYIDPVTGFPVIITPPAWPGAPTLPRITPTTNITIYKNPPDAPPVDDTVPLDGGQCDTASLTCQIDWTPIENLDLGTKFPFGVPTWLSDGLSGNAPAGGCPTLSIPFPPPITHPPLDISFCSTEWETTYRPWVFPLLEALMTIAGIAFLAVKVIGLGDTE